MQDKKPSRGRSASKRGKATKKTLPSTLELVRKAVRRFILDGTTLADFRKAVRLAAEKGRTSPKPMPDGAFRKIVRDAVAERKRNVEEQSRRRRRASNLKSGGIGQHDR